MQILDVRIYEELTFAFSHFGVQSMLMKNLLLLLLPDQ